MPIKISRIKKRWVAVEGKERRRGLKGGAMYCYVFKI